MSEQSANLSLPYIQPSQAQKHVTHNEALRVLDAVVQLTVNSADETAPPAATDGQRWIVAASATGAWAGQDQKIAVYDDNAWAFFEASEGWLAYDRNSSALLVFDGAVWVPAIGTGAFSDGSLTQVGVNTTADATNRLAVKSDQALFSHDDVTPGTGDVRLVANKDATARDAGFALQTGYTTHALFGLYGSDDMELKVSPDGTTYQTAMRADNASGNVAFGGVTPSADPGTMDAGGALMVRRETNAHNTASSYTAFVLGAPGDSGGLYAISRSNPANRPFTGVSGWDSGSLRIIYFGGGGWACPDANEHRFYCAPTYTESNNTGKLSLLIRNGYVRNETDELHAAVSPNGTEMRFQIIEEDVATGSGATVDSSIQIPDGAVVFNVSSRVTSTISGAASFDVGTAATADQFGASLGTAAGAANLGTISPTGFNANTAIRLTANGGNFAGGSVRIAICFYKPLAPSS